MRSFILISVLAYSSAINPEMTLLEGHSEFFVYVVIIVGLIMDVFELSKSNKNKNS